MRLTVCLSTLFSLAIVGAAFADDIEPKDLPSAVRATIEKELEGGAVIEDVERERKGNKVHYEVELERDNQEWDLKIDESGKVIERRRDT